MSRILKGPPPVERIEYLGECVLRFYFKNTTRDIDISAINIVGRYPKLKDPEYVKKSFYQDGSIRWPDFGPWLDADELEFMPEVTVK